MIILSIRTEKVDSELALFEDSKKIDEIIWEAHRTLSETIHTKIKDLLDRNSLDWHSIEGIICYKGPGSFTGLRIGLTVANSLAYGLKIAVIGQNGNDWQSIAIKQLLKGENQKIIIPEYGAPVNITRPKK